MPTPNPIQLPTLDSDHYDQRSIIENHIVENLLDRVGRNLKVKKYYNTANEQIYEDALNLIQSGVPGYFIRTTKEDTDDANPNERMDDMTSSIEIICVSPVGIEKNVQNVDRYCYTMIGVAREVLRENLIYDLPNNNRRPFVYTGNRDIFRDDDVDIVLAEFNVQYVVI